jgi:DNA (cytosine-5)-methyltransferase 1
VDVFSGAGLFSAGLVRAGFKPVLAVDIDSDAVATYNATLQKWQRFGVSKTCDRYHVPMC